MEPQPDLTGRRAIVTGGASGIGRAAAEELASRGASVVVTDIDESLGHDVASVIGGRFHPLDVGSADGWDRVIDAEGPFDLAFLNAGVSTTPPADRSTAQPSDAIDALLPLAGLSDDHYRRIMSVNVDGVVLGARAVLPGMIDHGSGDIVATASIAGLVPIAMDPIYGLTKHAVVGFVRSLGEAIAQHPDAPDVCLSAICPGFTDTNILDEQARARLGLLGLEIMPTSNVVAAIDLALVERKQGAQWVIWPGRPPYVYEWNPAVSALPAT